MNEQLRVNPNTNASFIQNEMSEPLCSPLESILDKKVHGVALNIFEVFIDYIASFFEAYNHRQNYLSRVFSEGPFINSERQIQTQEKSEELVFHAEGLSNLLLTTLESLKSSIVERGIQSFKDVRCQLTINETSISGIFPVTKNTNFSLDDLDLLEPFARRYANKIAEEVSGSGNKLFINWDFVLIDDKGEHTFSFIFKKTPNFEMVNGALFGSPGYQFESHDYKTSELPSILAQL